MGFSANGFSILLFKVVHLIPEFIVYHPLFNFKFLVFGLFKNGFMKCEAAVVHFFSLPAEDINILLISVQWMSLTVLVIPVLPDMAGCAANARVPEFKYESPEDIPTQTQVPQYSFEEWSYVLGSRTVANVVASGDIPESAEGYLEELAGQLGIPLDELIDLVGESAR